MYHVFNVEEVGILHTECIYVLHAVFRTNSVYSPEQH